MYQSLIDGLDPERPSERWVTESDWQFMKRCWAPYSRENQKRPVASDVLGYIKLAQAIVMSRSSDQDYEILDLTGCVSRDSKYPVTGGGFADIYLATWTRKNLEAQTVRISSSSRLRMFIYPPRLLSKFSGITHQTQTSSIDRK